MKENEIKAIIPLMNDAERLFALQTGQISMYDLLLYESCKNEPYDYLFMALPFEQALDWSLRIAKENVYKSIEAKANIYKWINDIEENGIVSFNSTGMQYDDLVMATALALKSGGLVLKEGKWTPEAFDSDYAKCFDNPEYRKSQEK